MALKVKAAETKAVLVNLLICIVVFYTVYYVVLSVCFAVFRIKMLDGLAPFDFKTNPSWINPYYLVLVISLETTFFICGLLFALVVEEWVWDYAVTVTVIHIIVTSVEPSGIGSAGHGGSFQQLLTGATFVAPLLAKTRPSKTNTACQGDNFWWAAPAVMSEFPLMLHWWLALGSGVISMICGGQILAYYLFKDNFIYPILDDF